MFIIYEKETGKIESVRELDSVVSVDELFSAIYGSKSEHYSLKFGVIESDVNVDFFANIIDQSGNIVPNPNYTTPAVEPTP